MFPVFSLVLDEDVPDEIALRFPELYKDLSKVSRTYSNDARVYGMWYGVHIRAKNFY